MIGASLAFVVASASPASAFSERVPAKYFGTNVQNPYALPADVRDRHLAGIAATGMTQVRLPIPWSMIEPEPPRAGAHDYRWGKTDDQIQALARHGLQAQALFAYAPTWASNATPAEATRCRENGAAGLAAGTPVGYAAAARALAARYGPGGSFWAQHEGLDPRPIRLYEIWNAPNTAGAWCPRVDPGGYAHMFMLAAQEIREVAPAAKLVVGGVGIGARTQGGSLATDLYLKRMVAAKPSIKAAANAVGAHLYPGKNPQAQLNGLRILREWLRAAGFPDSTPMLLNEIGFSRVGSIAMTEPERTASYANVMRQIPRVNCNVSGVLQYTWATPERNLDNAEDWFGVANPGTGLPYASGQEYTRWTKIFRGAGSGEAPRSTIDLCPGMPAPDRDGDGTPDEADELPLDPEDGRGGGGGAGQSGPGLRCSKRMIKLTAKIAASKGAARRKLERRYVRTKRRCVPCKRKMARIRHRLKESNGDRARQLRSRKRRIKRNCAPCIRRLRSLEIASLSATEAERLVLLRKHALRRKRCTGSRH